MSKPSQQSAQSRHRERFIGVFVNEMYAILLGIGMGSVIVSGHETGGERAVA